MPVDPWSLVEQYSTILDEGNPFLHDNAIDAAPESKLRRLARLAVKGATFGIGHQDITPETPAEYISEFLGSVPSTLAASAVATPAAGAFLKAAPAALRASKTVQGLTAAGMIGTGIGAGKALQQGDVSLIPEEALWWMGAEGVGRAGLAALKAFKGNQKTAARAAEAASETALVPREKIPYREGVYEEPTRVWAQKQRYGQPEFPTTMPKALPSGLPDEIAGILEPPARAMPPSIRPERMLPEHYNITPLAEKSETARLNEIQAELKKRQQAELIDNLSTPQPPRVIGPEPIPFTQNLGPAERYVKGGGTPRAIDEFGNEILPDYFGEKRAMDEFGILDSDRAALDNYVRNVETNKGLLEKYTEPTTGLEVYKPKDVEVNSVIEATTLTPRQVPPPFDNFQVEALQEARNIKKLDKLKENKEMTTSELVKLPEEQIEKLTNERFAKPVTTVIIEDTPGAKQAKKLIKKWDFPEEEVIEMERIVENRIKATMEHPKAVLIADQPEMMAQLRLKFWKDEITKRRPC